jgi:hypothetical protein
MQEVSNRRGVLLAKMYGAISLRALDTERFGARGQELLSVFADCAVLLPRELFVS